MREEYTHHQLISRLESLLAQHLPSPEYDNWEGWRLFLEIKDDLDLLSKHGVRLPPVLGLPHKVSEKTASSIWWVRANIATERREGRVADVARPTAEHVICQLYDLYRLINAIDELKQTTKTTEKNNAVQ